MQRDSYLQQNALRQLLYQSTRLCVQAAANPLTHTAAPTWAAMARMPSASCAILAGFRMRRCSSESVILPEASATSRALAYRFREEKGTSSESQVQLHIRGVAGGLRNVVPVGRQDLGNGQGAYRSSSESMVLPAASRTSPAHTS